MTFSFRGTVHSISLLKVVGLLIAVGFCVGMIFFVHKIYQNYVAIRAGEADPLWQRQLKSTVSRSVSNPQVTEQDIAKVASVDGAQLGNASATLKIVEFLDFDCPYCQSSFAPVRELMELYKDRVHFTARDFPVVELHPDAMAASLAARCAKEQGKYWAYHDALFLDQTRREDADFLRLAREIGLEPAGFETCYRQKRYINVVNQDIADGLRAGVQGTPTFFFNGIRVQGSLDRAMLEAIIQQFILAGTTSTGTLVR